MQHTSENLLRSIKKLVMLHKRDDEARQRSKFNAETQFPDVCAQLQKLYNERHESIGTKVQSFIDNNRYLEGMSFLEATDKLTKETQHSLFLKYVWHGEHGARNLLHFLQTIPEIADEPWVNTVAGGSYIIRDELSTRGLDKKDLNGKRIDLLIVDEDHKWLVCIENKVNARLHNAGTSDYTQLEAYYQYCEQEYSGFKHKKYIVLSHNENNAADTDENWLYANYHQLFGSILKRDRRTSNPIVEDYLKALYRLVYGWGDMKDVKNGSLSQYTEFYKIMPK